MIIDNTIISKSGLPINIGIETIGNAEVNAVNARELHEWLEIGKDFSNWIKQQLELDKRIQTMFKENIDYLKVALKGEKQINYILTLECAKHIAMMSRTEKGFEVRQAFIKLEEKFIELLQKTKIDLILQHNNSMERLIDIKDELEALKDKSKNLEIQNVELKEKLKHRLVKHGSKLSEGEKTKAYELSREKGLPYEEIANVLGRSLASVKNAIDSFDKYKETTFISIKDKDMEIKVIHKKIA